jgi:carbamoyl-phosphate synthase large subunit
MKSVGEAMAIGRTFKEAFMKGVRSLELGRSGLLFAPSNMDDEDDAALRKRLAIPTDRRMWDLFRAIGRGWTVERLHEVTHIDPWFLQQFTELAGMRQSAKTKRLAGIDAGDMRRLKRAGFGDQELALAVDEKEGAVRERREGQGLKPVYKRVDTCAAEFESFTPYLYSTYEQVCESNPNSRSKVVILGSGPNRIGQGIEFDYCCCHASFALKEEGLETIMINCNPETVSTDYDTADRLYFQPLTFEDVMAVIETERSAGGEVSCLVQFSSWRWRCRRRASRFWAPRPTRSTSPRIASASRRCSRACRSPSRRAARRPRASRRGRWRRRSASRWWCGHRTSSAAAGWRSSTTSTRSTAT